MVGGMEWMEWMEWVGERFKGAVALVGEIGDGWRLRWVGTVALVTSGQTLE